MAGWGRRLRSESGAWAQHSQAVSPCRFLAGSARAKAAGQLGHPGTQPCHSAGAASQGAWWPPDPLPHSRPRSLGGAGESLCFWKLILTDPTRSATGCHSCHLHGSQSPPPVAVVTPSCSGVGLIPWRKSRGFEEPGKGLETNLLGQVSGGAAGKPLGLGCLAPNLTSDLVPGAPTPGLGWRTPDRPQSCPLPHPHPTLGTFCGHFSEPWAPVLRGNHTGGCFHSRIVLGPVC